MNESILKSLSALKNGAALSTESTLPPLLGEGTHTVAFRSASFRNANSQSNNPVVRVVFGNDEGAQLYSVRFMPEAKDDGSVGMPINLRIFINQSMDVTDADAQKLYDGFYNNEIAPVIAQDLDPTASVKAIGEAAAAWIEGLLLDQEFIIDVETSNNGGLLISDIEPA